MTGTHGHAHNLGAKSSKLYWAITINVLLTVVQLIGGLASGSLSLIADALHNFSDAGSLVIAAVARKIAKLPANNKMTFGYKRAEILGALINSTTLIVIAVYLLYESAIRFLSPNEVDGLTVVWIAGVALIIDIATAMLTFGESKENINIKAAFIHNVSDALASVVVIISGLVIYYFKFYIIDLLATVLISIYILFQSSQLIKQCISILMQRTPAGLDIQEIETEIVKIEMVVNIHHIHLWQLDDDKYLFEAHIVVAPKDLNKIENIKGEIRELLVRKFKINHSTLEIEEQSEESGCTNKRSGC